MNIDHEYGTQNTKISSNTFISHKTYKQFALVEYRIVNLKQNKVDSIKDTENMYCKMKLYMDYTEGWWAGWGKVLCHINRQRKIGSSIIEHFFTPCCISTFYSNETC